MSCHGVTACHSVLHSVLHSFEASRVQQPVKVITGAPVVQQTAAAGTPLHGQLGKCTAVSIAWNADTLRISTVFNSELKHTKAPIE